MSKLHKPPPLPPGTKPLSNQVAGHKYGDGKMGKYKIVIYQRIRVETVLQQVKRKQKKNLKNNPSFNILLL